MLGKLTPWFLVVAAPAVLLYPLWSNPVSAGEDDVIYYYPLRKGAGAALRACVLGDGEGPADELSRLMGDPQAAVMYPPTWLFASMGPKPAYALSVFLAFWLAGAGAYLYARSIRLALPAAAFSAVAFMFCGFMVGHRVHLAAIHTAAYLPWGLWCIELLRRSRRRAFFAIAPIAYLALTAGHWPSFIQISLVWFVYLLFRARPLGRCAAVALAGLTLALAAGGPQLWATGKLLAGATRGGIGYAIAGENSFFAPAAVLFLFPFLMGSRTPNFFAQKWWGPWDHCEMLGYVGLVTLVLAGACVWRLWRRRGAGGRTAGLVKLWTWTAIGAGIWMLGYYLPSYRLVHAIPILSMVRCPARMVLVLDMALAVLAGMAIDALMRDRIPHRSRLRLARTIRRIATGWLAGLMVLCLVGLVGIGVALRGIWAQRMPFPMTGGANDILAAVHPTNPGVWVPLVALVATVLVVRFVIVHPRSRASLLVVLLLGDLFVVARFVDVPAAGAVGPDPEVSPAAQFLRELGGDANGFRVWGLARSYHDRPGELLLPMTSRSLGFESIATYGPFQSPAHAQLLGFRIFGTNRNWMRLIRRNYLLSLYNVRYILAAEPRFRRVIESVVVPFGPPPEDGLNLLGPDWRMAGAAVRDGVMRLRARWLWDAPGGSQEVRLAPSTTYRISLDARGPDGGAGHYLRAEIRQPLCGPADFNTDPLALIAWAEQIGTDWRHFEWTFETPDPIPQSVTFRLYTPSERLIEVRDIALRQSRADQPVVRTGGGPPGRRVYRKLAELPALDAGEPPVTVYENTLCEPVGARATYGADPRRIEQLKWRPGGIMDRMQTSIPDLFPPSASGAGGVLLATTAPTVAVYVIAVLVAALVDGRNSRRRAQTLAPGRT